MNTKTVTTIVLVLILSQSVRAQGNFQYDQQSADEAQYQEGGLALGLQPLGQSFQPTLNAVDFIRIYVYGGALGDGTLLINLRSDSIAGTILASTALVTVSATTAGFVNFLFDNPVPVTPGLTYYFQPVVVSGGGWGINQSLFYHYSGGMLFANGVGSPNQDLWFREGIVVPEPSTVSMILFGGVAMLAARLRRRHRA
jgi:PEP-CTERM motif